MVKNENFIMQAKESVELDWISLQNRKMEGYLM